MRGKYSFKLFLAFACWTTLAFVFASQSYIYGIVTGEEKDWSRVFFWTLTDWYLWALLSPAIFRLARRFVFESGKWQLALGVHAIAAVAFSLLHIFLQAVVQSFCGWSPAGVKSIEFVFGFLLTKKILLDLLTYAAIVAVSHAALYYRRYHEREAQLAQARLQSLQMQLQPHFLFNTLNTISELVHRDPQSADRTIVRLGDLLRRALETENSPEITLRRELEFLEKYLEIEKTRFHDRLTVEYAVEPETLDACVPSMILQPLVENAVQHGVNARPGAGKIEIRAERVDGNLNLKISDDGTGFSADNRPTNARSGFQREGIGLSNTRKRLLQLYGERQNLVLSENEAGGLEVSVRIPFRQKIEKE